MSNMVCAVFGVPITDETLRAMPEYANVKTITALDRAREAFKVKNAEDKDAHALKYVEKLRAEYGNAVSTGCVFYNATGGTVKFVTYYDWEGHIWKSPYPTEVANGQWGAFLHIHTSGMASGSVAAVAYRGVGNDGKEYEWAISWSNPWKPSPHPKIYVEARQKGHYLHNGDWSQLKALVEKGDLTWTEEWNGCVSEASISYKAPVVIEAIFTLKGADF